MVLQLSQDFLDFLVQKGVLQQQKAQELKIKSVKLNKDISTLLLEEGVLPPRKFYQYRAEFFGVKFIPDIYSIRIQPRALTIIKKQIDKVKETQSFPFEVNPDLGNAKLVIANFSDYNTIQLWKMLLGVQNLEIYAAVPNELEAFISTKFGNLSTSEIVKSIDTNQEQSLNDEEESVIEEEPESFSKVAKLVNELLEDAIKVEASDIHIEPLENRIRVRFRIDGLLQERLELSRNILMELVTRIKILARLRIDETRLPQDGRILKRVKNAEFDIRVSIVPTVYGEKVVMRILPREVKLLTFEDLGLRGKALQDMQETLNLTAGIILITGPTGSGKTTTLATALRYLNKPEVNIITIEDPVEIRQDGLTQIQVNSKIGLTFAKILRSVLRQDPDIIMVGEIRDKETAELAIRAAMTGHLVLSTLHTNDAATAFSRLIDMGAEPYLVSSTVKLVVAQRLVRTLCMFSREKYMPTKEIHEFIVKKLQNVGNFDIYKYLEQISKDVTRNARKPSDRLFRLYPPIEPPFLDQNGQENFYLYKASPHPRCNNRAYKGRVGIFEVLRVTSEIEDMILKNTPADRIAQRAREQGTLSFMQDGLIKSLEGITTLDEVLRVASV